MKGNVQPFGPLLSVLKRPTVLLVLVELLMLAVVWVPALPVVQSDPGPTPPAQGHTGDVPVSESVPHRIPRAKPSPVPENYSTQVAGPVIDAVPTPPSPWSTERITGTVANGYQTLGHHSLVVDDQKNAFVLWEHDPYIDDPAAEKGRINVTQRRADGTWLATTTVFTRYISCGSCHAAGPQTAASSVAMAPNGTLHALWLSTKEKYNRDVSAPYGMERRPDGTMTTPTIIGDPADCDTDATPPDIAVDKNGKAYALWLHKDKDTYNWYLAFAEKPAGGVWSAP